MTERPILMSAPMVRALLAGTETQTRRIMSERHQWHFIEASGDLALCPYGQPGDRLFVREAFRLCAEANSTKPRDTDAAYRIWYEANAPHQPGAGKLRTGIHMPRWASRITLEITEVRVERLQDISEADALAEGVHKPIGSQFWHSNDLAHLWGPGGGLPGETPQHAYRNLWESINGPGSWDANPWVWAVSFRHHHKGEG